MESLKSFEFKRIKEKIRGCYISVCVFLIHWASASDY